MRESSGCESVMLKKTS